jgi:hypothetical protein
VSTLRAHGLAADLPSGWEGEIYVRENTAAVPASGASGAGRTPGDVAGAHPVLQLANFALPPARGDFGGGAVELMGPRHIFVSLFDHGPESAGTALFADMSLPWPVSPGAFGPNRLQRALPGQAGAQWFFSAHGRPFCLYVVLGSHLLRAVLVRPLNHVLSTIRIS